MIDDNNSTTAKRQLLKGLDKVKIVVGNGFDLQCGLHSSYADYFAFVSVINDAIRKWERSFHSLYEYLNASDYTRFWCELNFEDEINVWDLFFFFSANLGYAHKNWCDVETAMLKSFAKSSYTDYWGEIYLRNFGQMRNTSRHSKMYIAALIRHKRNGDWFTSEKEFFSFLLAELKAFETRFGRFIKDQQDEKYQQNYENMVASLCDPQRLVSIDSFNYSVLNIEGYRQININGNYMHPIFGIDSQQIGPSDPRFVFTKTYRRIEADTDSNRIEIEHEFENVVVYGHSLCSHDYSYFFPVMDKLKLYDFTANGQIVFAYRVYNSERIDEIKKDYRVAIASLIDAYARYRGIEQPNRLLDSLSIFKRVWIYELKDIVKVLSIEPTPLDVGVKMN